MTQMATTLYAGPVKDTVYNFDAEWVGDALASGARAAQFRGDLPLATAQQLSELCSNRHRLRKIAGASGVLEPIWLTGVSTSAFNGWYLLGQFDYHPDRTGDDVRYVPFTLSAVHLPHGVQMVATRSARARANDFGLAATALVAAPFHDEDIDGSPFTVDPNGSRFTRTYDASHPINTPKLTVDADDARAMTLYASPGADVVQPRLTDGPGIPAWITKRGGDCRFYDRRSMREVYGPHPFDSCSDAILANGLIRCWVGGRRLPAYLHVEAFAAGVWREVGIVQISTARLLGARLTKVTPDVSILALTLQNEGDVFVTLKRGERMFRLGLPSSRVRPAWVGTPPQSRSVFAANGNGRFGVGLDGGGDDGTWEAPFLSWEGDDRFSWDGTRHDPDIRLYWPPDVAPTSLARVLWWRPEKAAADLGGSGIFTAFGESFQQALRVYLDAADLRIKFSIGDSQVLAGPVQSFTAGQDVMICFRFSTEHGMALSVRAPNGTVTHVADATLTDPVVQAWEEIAYYANWTRWGDAHWGDSTWGGTTMFPDGVIDNDMCFDGWLSNAEAEALAAASHALDGLPSPEARLVWYGPFDAVPIPQLGTEVAGLSIDSVTDGHGFQKAIGYLDDARLTAGVFLARSDGAFDTAAAQHAQLAAESEQTVRVR